MQFSSYFPEFTLFRPHSEQFTATRVNGGSFSLREKDRMRGFNAIKKTWSARFSGLTP